MHPVYHFYLVYQADFVIMSHLQKNAYFSIHSEKWKILFPVLIKNALTLLPLACISALNSDVDIPFAFAPAFKITRMSFLFIPIIKNPFDFTNAADSHDILLKTLHRHWKSGIPNA